MSVAKELIIYLMVLWRHKWLISACAILSAFMAFGLSLFLAPRYEAAATVRVASAPGGTDDYLYLLSLSRLSNTYIELAIRDINLSLVSKELGMNELPQVKIETVPETELIVITAIDADPVLACEIANTLANNMVAKSMQLYGGDAPTMREILEDQLNQAKLELDTSVIAYNSAIANSQTASTPDTGSTPVTDSYLESLSRLIGLRHQIYNELLVQYEQARINEQFHSNAITIVEPATIPHKPASPSLSLNAALGLVSGLFLGCVVAFLLNGLDNTLQGIEDIHEVTTLPVLCKIPVLTHKSGLYKRPNLTRHEITSPMSLFESIPAALAKFETSPKFTIYAITSPDPNSGKSIFAANLALTYCHNGKKVILVDLNLHRPGVDYLGFPKDPGISTYLKNESDWNNLMQTSAYQNFRVITAGTNLHQAQLTPEVITHLLRKLKPRCNVVLLDFPDLQNISNPTTLLSQANAIIMVVARYKTPKHSFLWALEQIKEENSKIAGIVFNRAPAAETYGYYTLSNLTIDLSAVNRSSNSSHN